MWNINSLSIVIFENIDDFYNPLIEGLAILSKRNLPLKLIHRINEPSKLLCDLLVNQPPNIENQFILNIDKLYRNTFIHFFSKCDGAETIVDCWKKNRKPQKLKLRVHDEAICHSLLLLHATNITFFGLYETDINSIAPWLGTNNNIKTLKIELRKEHQRYRQTQDDRFPGIRGDVVNCVKLLESLFITLERFVFSCFVSTLVKDLNYFLKKVGSAPSKTIELNLVGGVELPSGFYINCCNNPVLELVLIHIEGKDTIRYCCGTGK
jgi:hypothetical protein